MRLLQNDMGELSKTEVLNETEAVLVFDHLDIGERGVYSCSVSNGVNTTGSSEAIVSIEGQVFLLYNNEIFETTILRKPKRFLLSYTGHNYNNYA